MPATVASDARAEAPATTAAPAKYGHTGVRAVETIAPVSKMVAEVTHFEGSILGGNLD